MIFGLPRACWGARNSQNSSIMVQTWLWLWDGNFDLKDPKTWLSRKRGEGGRRLGFHQNFLFLTQIAQVSSCKIFWDPTEWWGGERGIGGTAPGLSEPCWGRWEWKQLDRKNGMADPGSSGLCDSFRSKTIHRWLFIELWNKGIPERMPEEIPRHLLLITDIIVIR